jgi:hypothetical protein
MASSPLSLPPQPSLEGTAPAAPPAAARRAGPGVAGLFVAVLAALLASFPARNAELWGHLAAGRALVRGGPGSVSPTWLYDLLSYGLFATLGGAGLVAAKAAVLACLAVVLFRLSRSGAGWPVAGACTALALLAVGGRALLEPATVSYLLLALAVRQAWRVPDGAAWPGWRAVLLFVVWANVDRAVALGLAAVALVRVGRWLDERASGGRGLLRALGAVAVLAAAAAAGPATWAGPLLPAELGWGAGASSPFARASLAALRSSPAALAYFALLGLGGASLLLALRWRWGRFLPWLGLAVWSAGQVRAVPFFAVVAGPVLAWGVQDYLTRRPRPAFGRKARAAGAALAGALAAVFLLAAWPGWLQRPPFEPRRWSVEPPAGLEQAAAAVRAGHAAGAWPAGTRTLHLTADTAAAFAWFCPEDEGMLAPGLAEGDKAGERLAAAGASRVVVRAADRGPPLALLVRLLADPRRWPLLHLEGGVAVFTHAGAGRPRLPGVDFDRLAFRPAEGEKAPPAPAPARGWWGAFWRPAAPPAGDRYQADVLLLKAEVLREAAPLRYLAAWGAVEMAALVGAAAGWAGPASADGALRLLLFSPPVPGPGQKPAPVTRYVLDTRQLLELARDDAPPGVLYSAVRAARHAVSAAPDDAHAQLLLGQCYLRLLTATRERVWALRLPQLAQLRHAQASAALNRAVALRPALTQAHLELGRLYRQVGYLDLALVHLRAYRDGGGQGVGEAELTDLAAVVERQRAQLAAETARARVADRAQAAVARRLAGEARAILLESDVSAFGPEGTQLELELLLGTGRAEDVRDWAAAELKGPLGAIGYHWRRARARAALGEYAAADAELLELAGEEGPDPARTGRVFAALAGRALLDERPGAWGLPALAARAWGRFQFRGAVGQEAAALAGRADAAVLRGLLALEAGEVERARAALGAALGYAGPGGGVRFNGHPVAEDALRLLR